MSSDTILQVKGTAVRCYWASAFPGNLIVALVALVALVTSVQDADDPCTSACTAVANTNLMLQVQGTVAWGRGLHPALATLLQPQRKMLMMSAQQLQTPTSCCTFKALLHGGPLRFTLL